MLCPLNVLANWAWWHPPVTPRCWSTDKWIPGTHWPSSLAYSENSRPKRLCLKNWSWVTPCRRFWRLSSTLHMWHRHACMPIPTHANTYVHACPYPHVHTANMKHTAYICMPVSMYVYIYVCTHTCLKSVLLNSPSKRFEKDSCGQGKRQKWNGLVVVLASNGFQNRTYLVHLTGLLYGPSLPCVIWKMKFRMVKWLEDQTVTKEWMSLTLWPFPSHFLPTLPSLLPFPTPVPLSHPSYPLPPFSISHILKV